MSTLWFTVNGDRISCWSTDRNGVPTETACWEGWRMEGGGLFFRRLIYSQTPTWP